MALYVKLFQQSAVITVVFQYGHLMDGNVVELDEALLLISNYVEFDIIKIGVMFARLTHWVHTLSGGSEPELKLKSFNMCVEVLVHGYPKLYFSMVKRNEEADMTGKLEKSKSFSFRVIIISQSAANAA